MTGYRDQYSDYRVLFRPIQLNSDLDLSLSVLKRSNSLRYLYTTVSFAYLVTICHHTSPDPGRFRPESCCYSPR